MVIVRPPERGAGSRDPVIRPDSRAERRAARVRNPERLGSGFLGPQAAAFDSSDNIYVADTFHGQVWKIPYSAGSYGAPVPLASNFAFGSPCGIAVDSNFNVFVADESNTQVYELMAPGYFIH